MDKEKKQMIMLSVLILAIIGVVIYFYWDRLIPSKGTGAELPARTTRLKIDMEGAEKLFEREDYKMLTEFGQIPIQPSSLGNDTPFRVEEEESETE